MSGGGEFPPLSLLSCIFPDIVPSFFFSRKASNFPVSLGSDGRTAQENPICRGETLHWSNSWKISAKFPVCTKFYIRNDSYRAETELNLNKNKFGEKNK